ncbi:hypothetical protein DS884_11190 [Tenacibaculum sp. E3R01]|uniref:hypothetical protein n=1 Tax=Tenacibaculum sp. E3R01 TaxID=2267227 RepID=UPI000DE815BE|nr:hypothetical protein [Tenacibaculum sp. E3R01]RBW57143.1 hypothetical protein DS884_11190 [Tenacibaculum sp. E3R01]
MNYKWTKEVEYGQYENGFVDVFQTVINGNKAFAIINYLPQFKDKDQKVLTTLILESNKDNWSKGTIKDILFDCEDRIKNVANLKFRVFNKLDYMTIQTFFIKDIENFEFGTNGDFSFE